MASSAGMFAPPAAQPDIVRAAQKDELYTQIVAEGFQDAARGVLGPRRALMCSRETQMLAGLLYHVLTTGAGSQTLGEEYCDLLQVTGSVPLEPSAARRALLVLLQSLVPYFAQRLAPAAAGSQSWQDSGAWTLRDEEQQSPSKHEKGCLPLLPHQRLWQQVKRHTEAAWNCLSQYSGEAARLHLALFYIFGTYYQWSKRLAGIRYAFIGKSFEQRASYRVLGTLLFLQLALTASVGAASALSRMLDSDPQQHGAADSELRQSGHAKLLQVDHTGKVEVVPPVVTPPTVSPTGAARSDQKCPLCLSVRRHPTATPCGHMFCWSCIAEWSNQKTECPLCRSPFQPSSLVCVHGSDL